MICGYKNSGFKRHQFAHVGLPENPVPGLPSKSHRHLGGGTVSVPLNNISLLAFLPRKGCRTATEMTLPISSKGFSRVCERIAIYTESTFQVGAYKPKSLKLVHCSLRGCRE